ncbi:MAG: class I SAM-dependent methyltransferase [Patescibacteria group bacterium]|nr:class I SAM-dependent methyltransferase [Patescibacteria group bacterium]
MVKIGWKIEIPVSLKHIASVLSYPPKYYERRIQKIGFVGKDTKVLDAACGAGVWAIAASYLNQEVMGIDSTERYLAVAKDINTKFKRKNLKLSLGKLEKLPYSNEYFDYIICYDAWMYTNRLESLKEMDRVLKSSGKIYLGSIAGLGWYLAMLVQGFKKGDRNLILMALKSIKNRVYMTENESRKIVEKQGFKILAIGSDGQIGQKNIEVEPQFKNKFLCFWNVFEILAEKRK